MIGGQEVYRTYGVLAGALQHGFRSNPKGRHLEPDIEIGLILNGNTGHNVRSQRITMHL